jgi:hypothetical protein
LLGSRSTGVILIARVDIRNLAQGKEKKRKRIDEEVKEHFSREI